ncbi:MAG: HAD hydrolase-like protein [Acidobacteriota bacterium]
MGKPSKDFFNLALADLRLPADQVVMVGDDLDADIAGACRAGLRTVLVRTGKYHPADLTSAAIQPDWVIDNVAGLPALLLAGAGS